MLVTLVPRVLENASTDALRLSRGRIRLFCSFHAWLYQGMVFPASYRETKTFFQKMLLKKFYLFPTYMLVLLFLEKKARSIFYYHFIVIRDIRTSYNRDVLRENKTKLEYKKSCMLFLRHTIFFDVLHQEVRRNIERGKARFVFPKRIREQARDAIANLPTIQTIFLTSLRRPCACEATCSDSDEPSAGPVVLQLAKRFPRHRIRSAILGRDEERGRFVSFSLSVRRRYTSVSSTRISAARTEVDKYFRKRPTTASYVVRFNRIPVSRKKSLE